MIKFRVWDKKTKSMWNIERWHVEDEYFDLIEPDKSVADPNANRVWRKQSDVILMQSTGMFDKNGVEVFIGDIVKCTVGCPHEVYLEKEYGGNFIGGMPAIYLKGIDDGYAWTGDEEVIGNIYQNPDLLESVEE